MADDKKAPVYYLLTLNESCADEHNVPALACMDEKKFNKWKDTRLSISAHLSNRGDDFMEDEQGFTGSQLIKEGLVNKYKVDEAFFKVFKKAYLNSLSLSNVFDGEEYQGDE